MRQHVTVALALLTIAWAAQAQTFPTRPITVVVPQQAGSFSDNVIRPLLPGLQEQLNQTVIIDNKAGANGIIGAEAVMRAKPDGYTVLLAASSVFVTNANLYKKLSYDPVKDFRSVASLGRVSMMYVTRPDFPAKSVEELVAYAKAQDKPLDIAYGSSTAQLAIALIGSVSGVKFNTIPYKGSPQLMTDLLGGTVQLGVVDAASGTPYVKSGKVRALATTDTMRSPFLPEVPGLAERYPGASLVSWNGLVVPAGTPDDVVQRLYEAVRKVIDTPEVAARYNAASVTPSLSTPAELDKTIREDIVRWGALMRTAGIEKE
ncbi:tripartite tricarboxylate transporter substrate binding protein [Variovorax sp. J22P168]|uniref:Bug family tripartite tricarboxylate transporter substrate binding protein n=1 Tax=Variovorax jilinensis TaxID=3053513 RepID=UPI002574EDF0|nr:tripartite tricarboxylate transporter substrate binding protein [Variovorax sp. J22P168]MDM0015165.1 tripartite tricarboxylate transporter substrate binding protein [Variovorax sp. J22P168]